MFRSLSVEGRSLGALFPSACGKATACDGGMPAGLDVCRLVAGDYVGQVKMWLF